MRQSNTNQKFKEWFSRYFVAELIGTLLAACMAFYVFNQTKSYALAAGAGFIGEGIGFYGYFISSELLRNGKYYQKLPIIRRLISIIAKTSTDMVVEFAPAELIDNLFIRPFLMYYLPQHLEPYILGFVVGKLIADAIFYVFVITSYEFKKHLSAK